MRIILLGSPGAGKGTLAEDIVKKHPVAHISTGDIFRENVKKETPLGVKARAYMDSGGLVPDELVLAMMENRLLGPDCAKRFLLDGCPRTIPQAEALDAKLAELGLKLDGAVLLDIDDDTVIRRLSGRRVCRKCGAIYNLFFRPSSKGDICERCGGELYQRDDDREEVVRNRLKVYYEQTAPLVEHYEKKGSLRRIRAEREGRSETLLEELERSMGVSR